MSTIAIVGGTGKEGLGLALRLGKAGHAIRVGSRDADKARARAAEVHAVVGGLVSGGDNAWAVAEAEVVWLCVPYGAHKDTLAGLASGLHGKVLIDITVPLAPPRVTRVSLPLGLSAALEAQELLGSDTRVIATLHHVSSTHLADLAHGPDGDALVCGDDAAAKELALGLVSQLGLRALDAGPLQNAIALEAMTPVLIHLTKRYKSTGASLRITGLP